MPLIFYSLNLTHKPTRVFSPPANDGRDSGWNKGARTPVPLGGTDRAR